MPLVAMVCKPLRVALVAPPGHDYAHRLIEGAHAWAAGSRRFRFIEIPYDETGRPPNVDAIEIEGALLWTHPRDTWVLRLCERGVPLVSLNGAWLTAGLPCVGMDLEATLDGVIEHLAMLDRRHAAYVGHLTAQSVGKQRQRDAFLSRAAAQRWTVAAMDVPGIPSAERQRLGKPAAERKLGDFVRALRLPAVVFCDDDYVAALVCRVAEHLGLVVPEDLAVLGYFDMGIARFSVPTISSVPGSGQLVGAGGMRLLTRLLDGKPVSAERLIVGPAPIVSRESTGGTTLRDDDIRRAHDIIHQSACDGLTVEQLLTQFSVSQKTLNKRFEAAYGRTLGAAIRHARAERAKELLALTDLAVARISEMCGFDEPSNFSIFFKREVGCTPGTYRATRR